MQKLPAILLASIPLLLTVTFSTSIIDPVLAPRTMFLSIALLLAALSLAMQKKTFQLHWPVASAWAA
ncbi:MAG: hypothetical protein MK081_01070 [Flavobacteriales bacterium]|nr:hypothetical protein [Flavobacteriales bacterium]